MLQTEKFTKASTISNWWANINPTGNTFVDTDFYNLENVLILARSKHLSKTNDYSSLKSLDLPLILRALSAYQDSRNLDAKHAHLLRTTMILLYRTIPDKSWEERLNFLKQVQG